MWGEYYLKKAVAVIVLILMFFLIYFLQINFFDWFTIAGIKPNLFVIYVLIIGIFAGKRVGTIAGFCIGMYIDILTGRFVGISAVLFAIIGFSSEYLNKNVSSENKITLILIVMANTFFYELIYYLISAWRLAISIELFPFLEILFIEIFYNSLLIIILYPAIQKFGNFLTETFSKKKSSTMYF